MIGDPLQAHQGADGDRRTAPRRRPDAPDEHEDRRLRDGVPAVTDGPFGEAKEQLAGVLVVDCDSIERAIEIAAPVAEYGIVEVRAAHGSCRHSRCDDRAGRRGPAAPARAAGPRVPHPAQRAVRRCARTPSRRRSWRPRSSGPTDGVPDNPRGWLITVASRRLTDQLRGDSARRRREAAAAALLPPEALLTSARRTTTRSPEPGRHADAAVPVLPPLALAGLPGGADAAGGRRPDDGPDRAGLPRARRRRWPSASAARRRASSRPGARFSLPPDAERAERLRVVLHVLYLIFNEGYTASSGPDLQRPELTAEAIRLVRDLHRLLPDEGEVAGLLALMLLTDARRPGANPPDGSLVPLAEQDRPAGTPRHPRRRRADHRRRSPRAPVGPYQLQAAIAAIHDEAPRAEDTDWAQIVALYELLTRVSGSSLCLK